MKLNDAQKLQVAQWIEQGLKMADIQKKLETEFNLRPTYMEVRFLIDDLKLIPKDPEPPKPAPVAAAPMPPASQPLPPGNEDILNEGADLLPPELPPVGAGNVKVSVDTIARPGAMVSGNVTFSDGQSAAWYLDQSGRLGLAPKVQGYKPSAMDVQEFQMELQTELQKMGF